MKATDQTDQQPTPTTEPQTVTYFWIAAIQKPNGDKYHCHSIVEVIPGVHTRASVTRDILAFLTDRHGDFVLLSLSLEPNDLATYQTTREPSPGWACERGTETAGTQ